MLNVREVNSEIEVYNPVKLSINRRFNLRELINLWNIHYDPATEMNVFTSSIIETSISHMNS